MEMRWKLVFISFAPWGSSIHMEILWKLVFISLVNEIFRASSFQWNRVISNHWFAISPLGIKTGRVADAGSGPCRMCAPPSDHAECPRRVPTLSSHTEHKPRWTRTLEVDDAGLPRCAAGWGRLRLPRRHSLSNYNLEAIWLWLRLKNTPSFLFFVALATTMTQKWLL